MGASSSNAPVINVAPKMVVGQKLKTVMAVFVFLGILTFVGTLLRDPARAWHGYLLGLFYFTSLALGGLFFAAIQHMTSAGWSVNIRRYSEALTAFLPFALVGAIGLLFAGSHLYSWLDPEIAASDKLIKGKAAYLNGPFFVVRTIVFFVLWVWFGRYIVGLSLKQDESGDESLTKRLVKPSIAFIMLFTLSYSLFSVDALMSLEPHWFSTIFGVYTFAGLFQSTMAVVILLTIHFMKNGQMSQWVNENHLHDLGKFLFAFSVFWAYIAFSQYMLIWYANLPEETLFFVPRTQGSWALVSVSLIVFKFIVPFFALLPRWAKRSPVHLKAVCYLILVMQFVDLYWLIFPNYNAEEAVFSFNEVLIFLGFGGVFLYTVTQFLSKNSMIPLKDPRAQESHGHHVVY